MKYIDVILNLQLTKQTIQHKALILLLTISL